MAKPNQSVTNGEATQVSFTTVRNKEACSSSYNEETDGTKMIPQAEMVLSSDHSSDSYFTMQEEVDSLWDDVSSLRRDFKAMTLGVEDYKDQSDDTTNYILRQQNAEAQRVDESVDALTTELSTLKVQMSILREKTIKNELVLEFLLQQADPVARRHFEATIIAPMMAPTSVGLSAQLDRVI
jgi:hypothetical protein